MHLHFLLANFIWRHFFHLIRSVPNPSAFLECRHYPVELLSYPQQALGSRRVGPTAPILFLRFIGFQLSLELGLLRHELLELHVVELVLVRRPVSLLLLKLLFQLGNMALDARQLFRQLLLPGSIPITAPAISFLF